MFLIFYIFCVKHFELLYKWRSTNKVVYEFPNKINWRVILIFCMLLHNTS